MNINNRYLTAAPIVILAIVMFMFGSCAPKRAAKNSDERIAVIATIFPVYDFARAVGGERVTVSMLLPPGVEAHGYEPTPRDIAAIAHAGLFVFAGAAMESWAPRLVQAADNKKITVVDASDGIALIEGHHHDDAEHAGEEEHDEDEHGGFDPHVWLDPLLARDMVRNIEKGLTAADPAGAAVYKKNADSYIVELEKLDSEISSGLAHLKSRTIVYGGHFAFGYFAKRYGLDHISPYAGFSPDAEPTPKRVSELADSLARTGTSTIFFEELVEPRVAQTISEETGAQLQLLHGAHNVGKDELASGITYLSIMRRNLSVLEAALGAAN